MDSIGVRRKISSSLGAILVVCLPNGPLAADGLVTERLGSCADADYRLQAKGRQVDDARGLRPVRHRAPIFRNASAKKVTGFLGFDEIVFGAQIKRRKGDWVQIKRAGFE